MDRRTFLQSVRKAPGTVFDHDEVRALIRGFEPKKKHRILSSTLNPWVPSNDQPWDTHTIHHLYRRAGFGATLAEIKAAEALTSGTLVDRLLDDQLLTGANLPSPPTHADQWLT